MSEGLRLKDQPASDRPQERLVARGPDALRQAELIAILLRTGLKGTKVVFVGQSVMQKFGLLNAPSRSRQSRQRATSVLVLPVPAPAMTRTLPRASTAWRCERVRALLALSGAMVDMAAKLDRP